MNGKRSSIFFIGLLLATLLYLIIWYWQKSTRAEDGALALLDRLKRAEENARRYQEQVRQQPEPSQAEVAAATTPATAVADSADSSLVDNLQRVKGIGPVFEGRLHEAGIVTLVQLTALPANRVAELLDVSMGRAARILAEAQRLT